MATVTLNAKAKRFGNLIADEVAVTSSGGISYSSAFEVNGHVDFGLWIQCVSASGAAAVDVYVEYAPQNSNSLFAQLEGGSKLLSITDENPHVDSVVFVPSAWVRLKFVGKAAGAVDTKVTAVLSMAARS